MWWFSVPLLLCVAWVFVFGLCIGSFLNVLIARLPFEKGVAWPGSRCFTCLRPLRLTDNLPIIGYLRLGGRCRFCQTPFSARYIWVELVTGLAFVAIFIVNSLSHWHNYPGITPPTSGIGWFVPPMKAWLLSACHAFLMAMLIASAVIDFNYRIIPGQITYFGTFVGIVVSTLFPWPWPNMNPTDWTQLPGPEVWSIPEKGSILTGVALWPIGGPLPAWLPYGSWQLGLCSGLLGAIVGQTTGRLVKNLFEVGFQQEALGLGDADLLMMIGSFLGWQIALIAMPIGAIVLLPLVVLLGLVRWIQSLFNRQVVSGSADGGAPLPFGPGIVAGALVCWFGWPVLGEGLRIYFFSAFMMTLGSIMVGGGLLFFGFVLRR